jgi:hypothetical protein
MSGEVNLRISIVWGGGRGSTLSTPTHPWNHLYFQVSHPTYDRLQYELIGNASDGEVVFNTKDWNEVYSGNELVIAGRLSDNVMKLKLKGSGPKGFFQWKY